MITDAISTPARRVPGRGRPRRERRRRRRAVHRQRGAERGGLRGTAGGGAAGEIKRATLQQSYDRVLALKAWLDEPAAVRAKRQAKARRQAFAAAHRSLTKVTVVTGSISPKSVVASGHGLFFAQNMMYRHTITVYNRSFRLVKTIPDSVDLAKLGAPTSPASTRARRRGRVHARRLVRVRLELLDVRPEDDARRARRAARPRRATTAASSTASTWRSCASTGRSPVGSVPKYVAVTPDGRFALVSNWCSYSLSVVSTKLGRQVRELPLGPYPRGIAVSPDSKWATWR